MRSHQMLWRMFWLGLVTGLAAALTWFYQVHEGLPRYLRAPTSLLLAPVASVDGLCYALGISGIYGKIPAVFVVNWLACLAVVSLFLALKRRWQNRHNEHSREASAS